ncbi:hypothetical protein SCACP_07100 [Sporomusa carbonis]
MKSNKDFFLGVLLVTLHRWRLTYAYTNNTPVHLYWILHIYAITGYYFDYLDHRSYESGITGYWY